MDHTWSSQLSDGRQSGKHLSDMSVPGKPWQCSDDLLTYFALAMTVLWWLNYLLCCCRCLCYRRERSWWGRWRRWTRYVGSFPPRPSEQLVIEWVQFWQFKYIVGHQRLRVQLAPRCTELRCVDRAPVTRSPTYIVLCCARWTPVTRSPSSTALHCAVLIGHQWLQLTPRCAYWTPVTQSSTSAALHRAPVTWSHNGLSTEWKLTPKTSNKWLGVQLVPRSRRCAVLHCTRLSRPRRMSTASLVLLSAVCI